MLLFDWERVAGMVMGGTLAALKEEVCDEKSEIQYKNKMLEVPSLFQTTKDTAPTRTTMYGRSVCYYRWDLVKTAMQVCLLNPSSSMVH
mmetsp:Transcript_1264/g.2883  ORF Transcript_1264/g.2883 Transcript_1264/m.2883 type:complete len:89 (-) Transcript_1264:88-354(-)